MESWCFDSLDKGYVSNGAISSSDSIFRTKNVFSYGNSDFPEVGFAEMIRKQVPHDSMKNVLDSNVSVGDIINPNMVTFNSISGDEESSSKLSSSVVESKSQESSLIDLKLDGIGLNQNSNSSTTAPILLSSAESSTAAKRVRVTSSSSSSQIAYCQVYGCHKDLSSTKDYHKKHKVCDIHTKTAKVIVNGIEQRFCQQCSRFHLLAEFDDGKRSCRKRLAGHNERRRKPQVGLNSSRTGRSLHSYTGSIGSKYQGTTLTETSFICQDIVPKGPFYIEKYGKNGWGAQKSVNSCSNGQLKQKTVLPSCLVEKQYSLPIEDINNGPTSVFSENINQYSLGNQDFTHFDATERFTSGISESGCALSLLSSRSHNSSGHSSGPLIMPSKASEKLYGIQKRYSSSYSGDDVNSEFSNGILQGSQVIMNVEDRMLCEDGSTIDLLQLSSQLHRVENTRQSNDILSRAGKQRFPLS